MYLSGVSVGTEFCNAESPAIDDPSIWVVTIGKVMEIQLDIFFYSWTNECTHVYYS